MKRTFIASYIFSLMLLQCGSGCKPHSATDDMINLNGYVVGREVCDVDGFGDYWIVDFTWGTKNRKLGDTIVYNGVTYTNALKTKELGANLKVPGKAVSIFTPKVSQTRITASGCTAQQPLAYPLREFTIYLQAELR